MSDEMTEAVVVEETSAPTETPAAEELPEHAKYTYHVASHLQHDRVDYPIGSAIDGKLLTAEQFKILRRDGILKYASEVVDAAQLSAQALVKEEQLREQAAEIEQLRRQLAEAQRSSKKL